MNNVLCRTFLVRNVYRFKKNRIFELRLDRSISSNQYSTSAESEIKESKFEFSLQSNGPRVLRRKPAIDPFLKDIFCSKFNKELLAYPEILDKGEIEDLNYKIKIVESIMDNDKSSSEEKLKILRDVKLFAAPASFINGGFEAIATERCKLLETLGARNVDIARLVKNHWMGMTAVKEGVKKEYLDALIFDLALGNFPITLCVKENIPNIPNIFDVSCKASSSINDEWTICGEKIYNVGKDGYFIVACDVLHEPIQLFLVQPGARGVKIDQSKRIVSFMNTPAIQIGSVPEKEDLTLETDPHPFMKSITAQNRYETAAIAIGILKRAIKEIIQNCRGKYISGDAVVDNQLVQVAITKAVSSLYAIESMVYFTAGLQDTYENQDIEVEACATYIYAMQNTFNSINTLIEAIGMDVLPESVLKYSEDARKLLLYEDHTDKLRIYSALLGLQTSSLRMAEDVRKIRNPFYNPKFLMKKWVADLKGKSGFPDVSIFLEENLHPSLKITAKWLETCVLKMQYAVESLFVMHGDNVLSMHRDLKRLNDAAMEIYAATASVSRASRAYCIGLYNAENELLVASLITHEVTANVKKLLNEIEDGMYLNQDATREDVGSKSAAHGGTHFEHPLERVYF